MSGNAKKYSSWADVAKAFDKAQAELAERRGVPAPSKPASAAVMKTPAADHLERLKARLTIHREQRARAKRESGTG